MAGGHGNVGNFVNRKHQLPVGKENDGPPTRQDLLERQAAVQKLGYKVPVPGTGLKSQSIFGSGIPSRDVVTGPGRVGSPRDIQQANAQKAFGTQAMSHNAGQRQDYAQVDPQLWADSTMGSDSLDTIRDESFIDNAFNMGSDEALGENEGQCFENNEQDIESSDERSETDPEEGKFDQNNARYQRTLDNDTRQPIANIASIPMRTGTTRRFGSPQVQQQQSLYTGGQSINGNPQQYYNENQVSGSLGHQLPNDYIPRQNIDTFAPSEIDEDTIHSTTTNGFHANGAQAYARQANAISRKRQADLISDLDFDLEKLYNMPYETLQNQPFDDDPKSSESLPALSPMSSPETLEQHMERYKNQPSEIQAKFLATLTIEEWEEAGEWLVKQFSSVMNRIVDARRERRNIAAEFESKIAARDLEVKARTDSVIATLQQLKDGGQNLLRGATPT